MARQVRTRFAPSPTGYMHIGNLRSALYEYLIARSNEGKFILRIEDTDQGRLVEGSVDVIYKTLSTVGMKYDEGPDIGGPYGPYVQSQRKDSYLPFAKQLIEKGEAYYCFCSKDRLTELREQAEQKGEAFTYDRHCLGLTSEEINNNIELGVPYIIRQKMPTEGSTVFEDAVYGSISVENNLLEDQILIKSDGFPTYNFANVVDDHSMDITHVVRGSEYLSSTPKYNLLYKAFGWEIPTYVHLPLIVKPDGSKIAKRTGDASFEDLINMGFLSEAIVNYIVLLGWSPETNQEFFTLKELEQEFKISRISKSPAAFDMAKLRWFNAEYLRKMDIGEFHKLALPHYKGAIANQNISLEKVSKLLQPRMEVLNDIPEKVDFLDSLFEYDLNIYVHKKMKTTLEMSLENLRAALPVLKSIEQWNETVIHDLLIELVTQMGIKNGQMLWPVRTAITGKEVTPGGAIEIADILGKDETIRRIECGISRLESTIGG